MNPIKKQIQIVSAQLFGSEYKQTIKIKTMSTIPKESKWVKRYTDLREKFNMTESIDKLVEEVLATDGREELEKENTHLSARLTIKEKIIKALEMNLQEISDEKNKEITALQSQNEELEKALVNYQLSEVALDLLVNEQSNQITALKAEKQHLINSINSKNH